MSVVIGGGISGLLTARKTGGLVIEEQSALGGLYSAEDFQSLIIPGLPPFIHKEKELVEVFPKADIKELNPRVKLFDDKHLKSKICPECDQIPKWLIPDKFLYVRNFTEFLEDLSNGIRVVRGYPIKIGKNIIFTNRGSLEFKEIINTGSRVRLNALLGRAETLKNIGCLILSLRLRKKIQDWDILINGKSGTTFSHVIGIYEEPLYYVYSFHVKGKLPDTERVILDMKRSGIIESKQDIISIRARYIQECILYGDKVKDSNISIKECGRLGTWENFSLNESIRSALEC
ncbi:hypothetical protein DFR87_06010 [Metallosphaera hakonensis JCM 8857 = DSM 7519]|uniref:FAD-dependent oxidoreductase n=1 Tax=Metallosphaera hakonensis JCM 8857 = DSM 7519 TaxID=1293036 RepID=A0A2U9ITU1_9CREN|nr:hypothetical protein DFR87_06010 [Metallosphaera hakonensis JCM 8857 = DSM 7519]